jgi:hypothetical protein
MPIAKIIKKKNPKPNPKFVNKFKEIEKGIRNITSKSKIINKIATK